jgi:hypothetical protein
MHSQCKLAKDKPIFETQQRSNHPSAETCSRVEHVFAGLT